MVWGRKKKSKKKCQINKDLLLSQDGNYREQDEVSGCSWSGTWWVGMRFRWLGGLVNWGDVFLCQVLNCLWEDGSFKVNFVLTAHVAEVITAELIWSPLPKHYPQQTGVWMPGWPAHSELEGSKAFVYSEDARSVKVKTGGRLILAGTVISV